MAASCPRWLETLLVSVSCMLLLGKTTPLLLLLLLPG
jgi:hypothetical protein